MLTQWLFMTPELTEEQSEGQERPPNESWWPGP
jgi:hypothetical protein